jgi:hypothetical protein
MIIPNLSEDKILEELVADRQIVANEAKKAAKKRIARLQKEGRDGINEDNELQLGIRTKNNNFWRCTIVINTAGRIKWYHNATCIVESNRGTKDYYLIRGFSNNKPYFIKVSSHAIKRFVERGIKGRLNEKIDLEGAGFAPIIIRKGEIITWMKIFDPKFWSIIYGPDKERQNVLSNLYFTAYGVYLGRETEQGNIEFKTFLNNNKKLKGLEEDAVMKVCAIAHVGLNPNFYSRSIIERYENAEDEDVREFFNKVDQFKNKLVP